MLRVAERGRVSPWVVAMIVGVWSGLCVLGAVAILEFRHRSKTVEAREIRVVDGAGVVRAEITASDDGSARLTLRDAHGEERLALRAMADGEAAVDLIDSGRLRVTLEARPAGEAGLWMSDGNQAARMSLAITPKHGADLDLRTPTGAIHLSSKLNGEQAIETLDRGGHTTSAQGVDADRNAIEVQPTTAAMPRHGRLVPAKPSEL